MYIYSNVNLLCLYIKFFIWKMRFCKIELIFNGFLSWIKNELNLCFLAHSDDKRLEYLNIAIYRLEGVYYAL